MKLFDRQKKWEINLYSYYDHAGIVRHLEDMARQGWQLEKAGSVFWTYRRCKPAELRYAVVYFSKASQFDPEPPAEQREPVRLPEQAQEPVRRMPQVQMQQQAQALWKAPNQPLQPQLHRKYHLH